MPVFISSTDSDKSILDCCSLTKLFVLFSDLGILRQMLNASFATLRQTVYKSNDSSDLLCKVPVLHNCENILYHSLVVTKFAIFNGATPVLSIGHVILRLQSFLLFRAPKRFVVKPAKLYKSLPSS